MTTRPSQLDDTAATEHTAQSGNDMNHTETSATTYNDLDGTSTVSATAVLGITEQATENDLDSPSQGHATL